MTKMITSLILLALLLSVPVGGFSHSNVRSNFRNPQERLNFQYSVDSSLESSPQIVHNSESPSVESISVNPSVVLGDPKPTVWTYFGSLTPKYNLGQGFPDSSPPQFALDALKETINGSPFIHQYTRTAGHPLLVEELSRRYSRHLERNIDGSKNVAITVGASQALYLSLQMLVQPGDEVIVFEPYFDLYLNQIRLAGGIPVPVPLRFVPYDETCGGKFSGSWELDVSALASKITPRTRAIVLNSPHNPTGKVFTGSEMASIADAIRPHDRIKVLSDEVYKFIVHAPPKDDVKTTVPGHVHFASLPGMYERTLTISSAGKTFSATGWQVGWAVGPEEMVGKIQQLLPYVQFCANSVCQEALARSLQRADEPYKGFSSYYGWLVDDYTRKRDFLVRALQGAGFSTPDYTRTPGGGFFIMAGVTDEVADRVPDHLLMKENESAPTGVARLDWAMCEYMVKEEGVGMIPSSPFFSEERVEEGASDRFVRVAFCKQKEIIEGAGRALMCKDSVADCELVSLDES